MNRWMVAPIVAGFLERYPLIEVEVLLIIARKFHFLVEMEIDDIEDESEDRSIIDFPNFLMHIFRKFQLFFTKTLKVI